jgi:PKD domain
VSMMSTGRRSRRVHSARIARSWRAFAAPAVLMIALLAISTSEAVATESYGEVTRFGGAVKEFAAGAVPPQDEGKFVVPVGFAVEPQNPTSGEKNAVYVLDRTLSNTAAGELDYRLQKISSVTGQVLGSTVIEEKYTDKTSFSDVHPLIGLAVDPASKRVYTIECSMVKGTASAYIPVVGKLVAWSTEPEPGTKTLGPADALLKEDTLVHASEVAGESAFKVGGSLAEVLYAPAGLAVESSANGDVAIEAQAGDATGEGNTVIQLVEPDGTLGKHWIEAESASNGKQWAGNGLFAGAAAEEFGVDLYTETSAEAPNLATVTVGAGTATEIETAPTRGEDEDQALSITLTAPLSKDQPEGARSFDEVVAAGTPIVRLTGGTSTVYAALYAHPGTEGVRRRDFQAHGIWEVLENEEPEQPFDSWTFGSKEQTEGLGNIGVRLFEVNGTKPTIVDTIGGGAPNSGAATSGSLPGSCNIDYQAASLAAGAEGAVFVLTQPRGESDAEVIEFAPGGQHACPGVREGSVEVKEGANWVELQKGGEPEPSLTVDEGVPVTLSAMSLDQVETNRTWNYTAFTMMWPSVYEWTPFGFEWNLEGTGYTIANSIKGPEYEWPSPEVVEYTYAKAGIYHAAVRIYGDYGTMESPFLVHVLGKTPPEAKFTCKEVGAATQFTVKVGKPLSCDASGSKETPGTEIEYYKWEFGDGSKAATETVAKTTHTFSKSGKYPIRLEIHDKAGTPAGASVEHEVTVEEAGTTTTTSTTSSSTQTSTTNTTVSTTTTKTSTSATKSGGRPKELTLHQKLEHALKVCKKDKSRKKRLSCEKTARKKYAPKKKANKVKKGGKR